MAATACPLAILLWMALAARRRSHCPQVPELPVLETLGPGPETLIYFGHHAWPGAVCH